MRSHDPHRVSYRQNVLTEISTKHHKWIFLVHRLLSLSSKVGQILHFHSNLDKALKWENLYQTIRRFCLGTICSFSFTVYVSFRWACPSASCRCSAGQQIVTGRDSRGCETCSCQTGKICLVSRYKVCLIATSKKKNNWEFESFPL